MSIDIKRILQSNPWYEKEWSFNEDPHLKRLEKIKYKWKVELKRFEKGIYMVRGPRQVGKTTWIKQKIKEIAEKRGRESVFYFSCELLSKEELKELFDKIIEMDIKADHLFLDELSYVKDWQTVIKYYWDIGFLRNRIVVLTGSSSLDLKRGYERMPGRKGKGREIIFYPASFYDYVNIKKGRELSESYLFTHIEELNEMLKNYMLSGGFPLSFNELFEKNRIEESYEVYIDWIIGEIEKAEISIEKFKALAKVIMNALTNPISWQEIAKRIDVKSHHTGHDYIDKLERMFLIQYIYNRVREDEVQQSKKKKIYFLDPMVMWAFYGIAYGKEYLYENAKEKLKEIESRVVENLIFNHIARKYKDYQNKVFYYKTKKGEVDFFVEGKKLEVKWGDFKEKEGIIYITKDRTGINKIPASIFLYRLGKMGSLNANNLEKLAVGMPKILK